jgi:hypothetical protein
MFQILGAKRVEQAPLIALIKRGISGRLMLLKIVSQGVVYDDT